VPAPRWIDRQGEFELFLDELASEPAIGLDTEFHREKTYFPQLALLQLSWSGGVAVVDPLVVDVRPLARRLEGPGTVVCHAAEQDLEVLRQECGAAPSHLFDTQIAAAFLGLGFASLSRLVEHLIRRRLPKGDRLTDWTRRPLDAGQVAYAASDVEHLLEIQAALAKRASVAGVLAWVEEECERLRTRRTGPGEVETAWWRVKGSRSLRGKSRGVAQEVAAWRERTAQARNLPPRFILSDLALAGIVQRPPRSAEQLREVRGLDGRALRDGAATAILAAVDAGEVLPAENLCLPPPGQASDDALGPSVALAIALVAQIAHERGIEPTLLANRADVQALAAGRTTGRLASGWRAELVGESLRHLLSGEAALTGDHAGGVRLIPLR
jgi:ribonuclease D